MKNEETLALLKPIMLDGTEKIGDKVYCTRFGDSEIKQIIDSVFPMHTSYSTYTEYGYSHLEDPLPTLFKVNPFEWLAKQNNSQERVIKVFNHQNRKWMYAVAIRFITNVACCCAPSDTIEGAKENSVQIPDIRLYSENVWREVKKIMTRAEVLAMLDGDENEVLISLLKQKGVDTTNLIIE